MASVCVSGTLHKRRGGFGKHMPNAWQPRFFVLEDGVLRYFEDEAHRQEVRGEMRLNEHVQFSIGVAVEGAPTRHTIALDQRDGDRWKMCAETHEELQRWAAALEAYIARAVDAPADPLASPSSAGSKESPRRSKQLQASAAAATTTKAASAAGAASAAAAGAAIGAARPVSSAGTAAGAPKKRQVKATAAAKKGKQRLAITPENVEKALSVLAINLCFVIVALKYDLTFWVTVAVANALLLRMLTKQPKEPPVMKVTTAAPELVSSSDAAQQQQQQQPASIVVPQARAASTHSRAASSSSMEGRGATESKAAEELAVGADGIRYAEINGELYPVAGTTCQRAPEGSTPATAPPHTWSEGDATIFHVRMKGYNSHKQKAPSAPALMDLVAVDFVKTKFNVNSIGSEVALPDVSDVDTHNPNVPPIFIVNWQLPTGSTVFSTNDGPGYHAVLYFKIRPEVCEELKDLSTAREAVKLFAEYCERAPDDPAFRGRFKAMAYVDNLDQMGFPSFITKYNAKPVLIRKTGNVVRGPHYIEMDINVHSFAMMAKKGINTLMPFFKDMYINIGFTIEGRDDSELPECLFGCGQLHRPNQDLAVDLFEQPDPEDA